MSVVRCLAVVVVAATLAALSACGGSESSPPPTRSDALAASKPGELLAYVKTKLAERASWRAGNGFATLAPGAAAVGASAADSASHSESLVQEAGVDEDDLLKTDGSIVHHLDVTAATPQLAVFRRASNGSLSRQGTWQRPADPDWPATASGMHVAFAASRVAVLGQAARPFVWDCPPSADPCPLPAMSIWPGVQDTRVTLDLIDVSDAAAPKTAAALQIDGRLVGSRRIGNVLYLVTRHAPALAYDMVSPDTTPEQRRALLDALRIDDLLPRLHTGTSSRPLVAETDCYVKLDNPSFAVEITTISAFDLSASAAAPTSRCFIGGSEAMYLGPESLYLATTRWRYDDRWPWTYPPTTTTEIHKFALAGTTIDYRASGSIDGHLGWDAQRKPYRLGEHRGDLRVISFTGSTGWGPIGPVATTEPSPATLTILRERDGALETIGRLPNSNRTAPLGRPGEQVYGVRFLGDRAVLVTFRVVDPLYLLDLSDPADPKALGELEVTGFSSDLVPLANDLVLGVGREADSQGLVGGVKVALFDLSSAQPRQLASQVLGDRGSSTALDVSRQGLNLFMQRGTARIAIPMALATGSGNWQRALHRFEVDTVARTLVARPPIAPPAGAATADLYADRSVQIGAQVHYASGSGIVTADW